MDEIRHPKRLLDHRPVIRWRRPGRPLKRLPDAHNSEAETGHLLAQLRDQKKKDILKKCLVIISWATGWIIWILGFDSRRELGIFSFTTASRTALGPTQPPIQWVPGALYLGGKAAGAWSCPLHIVPRSKKAWSYTYTPPVSRHGA
jgi:hypothetical protein